MLFVMAVVIGSTASAADSKWEPRAYPPIPEAVSSFGATTLNRHIYVFGGHMGRIPGNSIDAVSPHFARLDLDNLEAGWEELPMLEKSQSPGLVAWNGKIYRVGGLSFNNSINEPTSHRSLDIFAVFDPETKTWKELASLPEPRSSIDASVVDGKLYVVGGWNLQDGKVDEAHWHEETLAFDLANENGVWEPVATPPFQIRALSTASHNGKLYVLGGMHSGNETSRNVYIYDPKANQWSEGPELPALGEFDGFAMSAFGANGNLYFAGRSGTVYKLNEAGNAWEPTERLLYSRMFHRLIVGPDNDVVVLGGISGTYTSNVESAGNFKPGEIKSQSWDVSFPGRARHSQALLLRNGVLYAFGGNASTAPHDFEKENFCNEAFAFDLAGQSVETLDPLPLPMQSGAAFVAGTRLDPSIYVVGGLAPNEEGFGATDAIQQYRIRSKSWNNELLKLPAPRSMFNLAAHDNIAWIFGGSAGRPLASETWSWDVLDNEGIQTVAGAEIPTRRRSFAGAVLGDKYYVVGGLGENTTIADKAFAFDFETKTWSEVAAPQQSRVFAQLAASGGKLYLNGGFSRVDGHFAGATTLEIYDPVTNSWSDATALQEFAPQLSKMSLVEFQDRLLFYGIDGDQTGLAHFVLIDPAPQTEGYGVPVNQTADRTAGQDLASQLKSLDKNQDGAVSLDEVGPRFQALVKRIDENNDGVASAEEIAAFTKKLDEESRPAGRGGASTGAAPGDGGRGRGGDPAERAASIFAENDADKDGLLKGDEISERLRNAMDRVDANQDGAIDQSELETFFRSFRGGRRGGAGSDAGQQQDGQRSNQNASTPSS